jgi:hypothetical protein
MFRQILHKYIFRWVSALILFVSFGFGKFTLQQSNLYRVHSLFLYNFTKHIKWQEGTSAPFTVGVYGNTLAFREIKENLSERKVWGEGISVIEISSSDEASKCQIVYIPKSQRKKIVEFLTAKLYQNTLIVTEEDMISDGAAISFVFQKSKMRFMISKDNIESSGLKVSTSLISVGIPV